MTGAYLATQKSRNLGVTFGKGTTQHLTFSKFTDFDKQIVYIGVIDLAEPKSGFKLGLLLHCNFDYFCQKTYPLFHDIIHVCNHDIQYSVLCNA